MATHSSILAWRIPMDRGAWRATFHRVAKSWTRRKQLSTHTCTKVIGTKSVELGDLLKLGHGARGKSQE